MSDNRRPFGITEGSCCCNGKNYDEVREREEKFERTSGEGVVFG